MASARSSSWIPWATSRRCIPSTAATEPIRLRHSSRPRTATSTDTTGTGGASGFGTVFKMDLSGNLTTLHSFQSAGGASPTGLVRAADGTLWGTTPAGGLDAGGGTVFRFILGAASLEVANISPASGPSSGGTPVSIAGTGFVGGARVMIGDSPADAVRRERDLRQRSGACAHTRDVERRHRHQRQRLLRNREQAVVRRLPRRPAGRRLPRVRRDDLSQAASPPARRRQLRSRQPRHPRADGGLPAQGRARLVIRAARRARALSRTCRARASSPTGSSSSPPRASRPAAAAASTVPTAPSRAGRWPCSCSRRRTAPATRRRPRPESSATCRRTTPTHPGSRSSTTAHITGGCQASPLLYCPDNPSTRGQMAVFLVKTFGL